MGSSFRSANSLTSPKLMKLSQQRSPLPTLREPSPTLYYTVGSPGQMYAFLSHGPICPWLPGQVH